MRYFFDGNMGMYKGIKIWMGTWRDSDGEVHTDPLLFAETSNQAEYCSLIKVLFHLLESSATTHIKEAKIYGDSLLVVSQMSGVCKCKDARLKKLLELATILRDLIKLQRDIKISLTWVPRRWNNIALDLKN